MPATVMFPLCFVALVCALVALSVTHRQRQAPLRRELQVYAYLTLTLVGSTLLLLSEPYIVFGLLAGGGGVIGLARTVMMPTTRSPEA